MALTTPTFLVDKSALEQRRHSDSAIATLDALIADHALAVCHMVALEVLYSARNARDYAALSASLDAQVWLPVDEAVMDRALAVQRALTESGKHRVPLRDLVVAATAEIHGAVVLHYDRDFDTIAQVTGQPTRWIVERGHGG